MEVTSDIAEITQQHAPMLLKTSGLINCLQTCILLAATPQAALIRLPSMG
jgi:hypothetical protein